MSHSATKKLLSVLSVEWKTKTYKEIIITSGGHKEKNYGYQNKSTKSKRNQYKVKKSYGNH